MQQIIAHIDMDSFFCACEEKRNPLLKNYPVIVGGTDNRGVVCTSNYNARKYGVFSAMPMKKALELCPNIICIEPDKKYYKEESDRIIQILNSFTNKIEQVSIDEAYLDLTNYSKNFDSIKTMAKYIHKKILKNTKLSCSIGISESRYVSKIASDYNKPCAITIINNPKEFLKNLDIKKISGIGKKSKEIYYKHNIKTIGDLSQKNNLFLYETFGKNSILYKKISLGLDKTGIKKRTHSKSISKENTYSQDIKDNLEDKIKELTKEVYKELNKTNFKTISIKIRYSDFKTITRDYTLSNYSNSYDVILNKTKELFNNNYQENQSIRLLGVKLSNLNYNFKSQMQLSAFC